MFFILFFVSWQISVIEIIVIITGQHSFQNTSPVEHLTASLPRKQKKTNLTSLETNSPATWSKLITFKVFDLMKENLKQIFSKPRGLAFFTLTESEGFVFQYFEAQKVTNSCKTALVAPQPQQPHETLLGLNDWQGHAAKSPRHSRWSRHVTIILSYTTYRDEVPQHCTSHINKNQKHPNPFIAGISLQRPQKPPEDKTHPRNTERSQLLWSQKHTHQESLEKYQLLSSIRQLLSRAASRVTVLIKTAQFYFL